MKFNGTLDHATQDRVDACDLLLNNPDRLLALQNTGLMDTPNEESFDRLAFLAARILKAPLTIVSLVSDTKQFFKAAYGLPSPMDVIREVPIDGSICRYTLSGEPIIANNANQDPILKYHPAVGSWNICAFIALPLIDPEGNVLGAFCAVDYKERKWNDDEIYIMKELTASIMTEINLRNQISLLNTERNSREAFVTALTHDLRTPLTAAKMSAQMIKRSISNPLKIDLVSDRIIENMERADSMIQDLLDAEQVKVGQTLSLNFEDCILNDIIKHTIEDLNIVHGNRVVTEDYEEINGHWDKMALRRILENLSINAIKYGSTDTTVKISILKQNEDVQIGVHNKGNPLSKSEQLNIFKPFRRTSSAAIGAQRGWGIGLTLVRGLAEAHLGKVSVKSTEEGTAFYITIPIDIRKIN